MAARSARPAPSQLAHDVEAAHSGRHRPRGPPWSPRARRCPRWCRRPAGAAAPQPRENAGRTRAPPRPARCRSRTAPSSRGSRSRTGGRPALPGSGRAPRPMPKRPRYRRPSSTSPAPMPVPTVISITCCWPRAAPSLASAQAAAFASFSTTTGLPMRSSTSFLTGSSRQARFGANSTRGPGLRRRSRRRRSRQPRPHSWPAARDHAGDDVDGAVRARRWGVPLQLLDDLPVVVDDARGDLRAADVNPDRQAHCPARLAARTPPPRRHRLMLWPCSTGPPRRPEAPGGRDLRTRRARACRVLPAQRQPTSRSRPAGQCLGRCRQPGWSRGAFAGPAVPAGPVVPARLSAAPGAPRPAGLPPLPRESSESRAPIASWTAEATAVACARQLAAEAGAGVAHPACRPADRAPLALRGLADLGRDLVSRGVPDIRLLGTAAAKAPANLSADLPAHVLGALADEPALKLAEQVSPRRALPGAPDRSGRCRRRHAGPGRPLRRTAPADRSEPERPEPERPEPGPSAFGWSLPCRSGRSLAPGCSFITVTISRSCPVFPPRHLSAAAPSIRRRAARGSGRGRFLSRGRRLPGLGPRLQALKRGLDDRLLRAPLEHPDHRHPRADGQLIADLRAGARRQRAGKRRTSRSPSSPASASSQRTAASPSHS